VGCADLADNIIACKSGRGVNKQNPGWKDTFKVQVGKDEKTITVVRTDCRQGCGWGQPLEIACTARGAMQSLEQLKGQCEKIPVKKALDVMEDMMGHCPMVKLDCTAGHCRGGPPVQCAEAPKPRKQGVTRLAEVITLGKEMAYNGFCLESVAGGGWTFVNEQGRSTTDITDVFPERLHGYHEYVYDLKGMKFNEVLVRRTSASWCDSWGHRGSYWGVPGLTTASMGLAMGTKQMCYHNGESG
jgi:hypothetical protein